MVLTRLPIKPLRAALFARLNSSLSRTVYKREPNRAASPFVFIGDIELDDWGTKTRGGTNVTFNVEVHSDSRSGADEAAGILDEVAQALTSTDLDLTADNYFMNHVFIEFSSVVELSSQEHRGIVRFQAFIDDIT